MRIETMSLQSKERFRKVMITDVAIVHNHPSTQTLSLQDVNLFLSNASIRVIVVVSNQGTVHYMRKDENYSFTIARELYNSCIEDLT